MKTERLMLSSDDAVLGGVCGGFARYVGVDPVWIRLGVVAACFATGFVPVLVPYFILMCVMPSDVEEFEASPAMFDSARSALKSRGTLAVIGGAFRMLLSIVFGVGFGLLTGGGAAFALGRSYEEVAILIGVASGFLSAATMATILAAHRLTPASKFFISLLLATGFGVSVAAGLMFAGFLGARDEEIVILAGVGSGCVAAGALITFRLYTAGGLAWRFFPPLFLGAGSGMLAGVGIEITGGPEEVSILIGAGIGILVFGFTAAMLFLGYFSPARAEARSRQRFGATQAWDSGAVQEDAQKPSRTNAILIGLAVALGIIPAGLFVVRSNATVSDRSQLNLVNTYNDNSWVAPAAQGTKCDESGCTQAATTLVSQRGQFNSSYERQHLCDVHARAAAWEAKQAGVSFEIFDIKTGSARQDLHPSNGTQPYQYLGH